MGLLGRQSRCASTTSCVLHEVDSLKAAKYTVQEVGKLYINRNRNGILYSKSDMTHGVVDTEHTHRDFHCQWWLKIENTSW